MRDRPAAASRWRGVALLAGLLALAGPLEAATGKARRPTPPPQPQSLAAALSSQVTQAQRLASELGVHVVEVESGAEVYSYHAETPLILASNTKLLTTAAALELLGPDFKFETPLLARGAVVGGVLQGDLAVVGSGDPNISGRFTEGDSLAIFRGWARVLAERGIREVAGDLYLVHGLFEPLALKPEWPADQLARWYEAPVRALSFNDNCILVRALPGSRPGARARVEFDPPIDFLGLRGQVLTTASARNQRFVVTREPDSREIVVAGKALAGGHPLEAWVTVPDPVEYFGAALRLALKQEGIEVRGATTPVAELPGDVWERLASHTSDLLGTLAVTNQLSQNFYAESLFKTVAAQTGGEGSWREGVRVVEGFLRGAGWQDGFTLIDGSGMSRGNRAKPSQLTSLLRYMFFGAHGAEYMRSLPISGSPVGAWKRRLATAPYRGNVLAKTGTLSGVSALSGYAKSVKGKLYAFSIVFNGARSVSSARRAQDGIVRALVDRG